MCVVDVVMARQVPKEMAGIGRHPWIHSVTAACCCAAATAAATARYCFLLAGLWCGSGVALPGPAWANRCWGTPYDLALNSSARPCLPIFQCARRIPLRAIGRYDHGGVGSDLQGGFHW